MTEAAWAGVLARAGYTPSMVGFSLDSLGATTLQDCVFLRSPKEAHGHDFCWE